MAHMKGLSQGTELLHFEKDPDNSEWYVAKLAINGTPAIPFSVPTPQVLSLFDQGEQYLGEYLENQARVMIERYGDGRDPRPDPVLLTSA